MLSTKASYTNRQGDVLSDKFNHKRYRKLQKIQANLRETLYEFDRFCYNNCLTYIADAGTLIGAVRHKGFIPWDDDIDFIMSEGDFNRLKKLKAPPGYKIDVSFWASKDKLKFKRRGIQGDIDVVTYRPKGDKLRTPFGIYDYDTIFPLKIGQFEGLNMLLPNSPEGVVRATNDMKSNPDLHQLPPIKKRYPHHILL